MLKVYSNTKALNSYCETAEQNSGALFPLTITLIVKKLHSISHVPLV